VISGYVPGVGIASHENALANGGRTVIVSPEGVENSGEKTIGAFGIWTACSSLTIGRQARCGAQIAPWTATRSSLVLTTLSSLLRHEKEGEH
jgi:hypothetical protein